VQVWYHVGSKDDPPMSRGYRLLFVLLMALIINYVWADISEFSLNDFNCPSSPRLRRDIFAKRKNGGKGIRTPDFQLAKLALYQLSYAPEGTPNAFACSRLMSELPNFDCRFSIARKKRKMPDVD
jgi:hypothetical protein